MDEFWQDLTAEELHFRDIWQFEVKNDLIPAPSGKLSTFNQEFYFFIPNSLQINEQTYTKEQFYQDQTNFIRYKTPEFTIAEILDPTHFRSPLNQIISLKGKDPTDENVAKIEDELKLLANVIRSALRKTVRGLIQELDRPMVREGKQFNLKVEKFSKELNELHGHYTEAQRDFKAWNNPDVDHHFIYIDEFISSSYNFYLSGLLEHLRQYQLKTLQPLDKILCSLLVKEKLHREKEHQEPRKINERSVQSEFILYRSGLLNKFVIDALLLETDRMSIQRKFSNLIGSFAAGCAMLIYLLLFVWQGQIFVITSAPFIILTVVAYVIKDRMKESLKSLSYQKATQIFSDFTTKIQTPEKKQVLGIIKESFSFVDESKLSKEVLDIRNQGFHNVLAAFKRPEQVLFYKKSVQMFPNINGHDDRRTALNTIFRFNIHKFLTKASDPYDFYLTLDPESLKLNKTLLPKVYHINIIMKSSFHIDGETSQSETRKIRLIMDKDGIKHIDQVT